MEDNLILKGGTDFFDDGTAKGIPEVWFSSDMIPALEFRIDFLTNFVVEKLQGYRTVSYTHLTLPTNREV